MSPELFNGKVRAVLERIADDIVLDGDPTDFLTVGSAMLSAAFDAICLERGIMSDEVYLDAFQLDPKLGLVANVYAPASLYPDACEAYDDARIRFENAIYNLGNF